MHPAAPHPDNAPCKFYVDEDCTNCQACCMTVPGIFGEDDGHRGQSIVIRQPETPFEVELCREAIEACPHVAIRDDGDKNGLP